MTIILSIKIKFINLFYDLLYFILFKQTKKIKLKNLCPNKLFPLNFILFVNFLSLELISTF